MNAKIADYITNDQTILEEPLETLAKEGQLNSYKHFGFWQPVDTIREKELLEKIMNEVCNLLNHGVWNNKKFSLDIQDLKVLDYQLYLAKKRYRLWLI